ncbi:MAG: DUF4157 domain-containing protein [Thermoleophilia bacterium]
MSGQGQGHAHDVTPGHEERARAPEAPEESPVERLASSVGNRAFTALARSGGGILPDGRAHPDVEAAIAASRGGGRPLDDGVRDRFSEGLGDPLHDVRVHDDAHANKLAASVAARAFAVGSDVFFAEGQHNPGSADGDRLLAHELTHVAQQRGAPEGGPLRVSEPGEAMEQEADRAADELAG